jgi:GntR family transcriptional regulator
MHIEIDFRSGIPIYTQIMEQVRQKVADGELKVGDQLPTVRQMATELRVNFNTVARAYRLLDEAGLISTQQGRGTYIWEKPSEEVLERLRKQSLEDLTRRNFEIDRRIDRALGERQPAGRRRITTRAYHSQYYFVRNL